MARALSILLIAFVVGLTFCNGASAQMYTETVVHNFALFQRGANPYGAVSRDAAGNFYGTTVYGGNFAEGVLFEVSAAGQQVVVHSFGGGTDGANPYAPVVADGAGNLYGTTYAGGTAGMGTVYKIAAGGQEIVLHNFAGVDGANPYAGVILDAAGNLYGTTYNGGTANEGTVFEVPVGGVETVLYSFSGGSDGSNPYGGVIRDGAGSLYGTTYYGGIPTGGFGVGGGVIFKLEASGTETVLYNFKGGPDGGKQPATGLVRDAAGNFYGSTSFGGYNDAGVVWKLSSTGWTLLYSIPGDGGQINGGVTLDQQGNIYGASSLGRPETGQIYKVTPAGVGSILYTFKGGPDGDNPYSNVLLDAHGNIYGTTYAGGTANVGALYELTAAGQESVLYSFPNGPEGGSPDAGLIGDAAGNLYGTTSSGGTGGFGTVYKFDSTGLETVLYSFQGAADGANPYASLIIDSAGNLYGTTVGGGSTGYGTVFKVDSTGSETVLASLNLETGEDAYGNLTIDASGNLYGTAAYEGPAIEGSVFQVTPAGQFNVLAAFGTQLPSPRTPEAGLILSQSGALYGTSVAGGEGGEGTVFEVSPTNVVTVIHSFRGTDGSSPHGALVADVQGNVYGTTLTGGPSNAGVVFQINPIGGISVLYSFTGGLDGGNPYSSLARDAAGNFYGTTSSGGAAGLGVVYKIYPSGTETVLYSFSGGVSGATPYGSVYLDAKGNIFGTTFGGGIHNSGLLFELKPPPTDHN